MPKPNIPKGIIRKEVWLTLETVNSLTKDARSSPLKIHMEKILTKRAKRVK